MEQFENEIKTLKEKLTKQNKRLLRASFVLAIISLLFYLALVSVSAYAFEKNETIFGAITMGVSFVLLFFGVFYALKMEKDAGYYECKNCKHKFVPTYKEVLCATHINTTRRLKCPKCGMRTWAKKVMSEE